MCPRQPPEISVEIIYNTKMRNLEDRNLRPPPQHLDRLTSARPTTFCLGCCADMKRLRYVCVVVWTYHSKSRDYLNTGAKLQITGTVSIHAAFYNRELLCPVLTKYTRKPLVTKKGHQAKCAKCALARSLPSTIHSRPPPCGYLLLDGPIFRCQILEMQIAHGGILIAVCTSLSHAFC